MNSEPIKRFVKNLIPWRLRYYIKLQEAKGIICLPSGIKQFRPIEQYNDQFYQTLNDLHITDFEGKTICELGPGQHLSHAFLEYQMGAKKEWLLEIADFAHIDNLAVLDNVLLDSSQCLKRELPQLQSGEAWKSYLEKINAVYSINGLEGYKAIPDNSVDYCFSYAVIEHIRKDIFMDTIEQMYRFMREGGVCYHTVDFTDHMGGKKNQLRFNESIWEDDVHHNMDNYTNRFSCSQIVGSLKRVGFRKVKIIKQLSFKDLPIKRKYVAKEFEHTTDADLKAAFAIIVLRK